MKKIRTFISIVLLSTTAINFAQTIKTNSDTRRFIDDATLIRVNGDWSINANFRSGLGETVFFYPIEAIDLKTNKSIKSMQVEMNIGPEINSQRYFRTAWIDYDEIEEFIYFLEQYVIPNLKDKTDFNQSNIFMFNSKEIRFCFEIRNLSRKTSIYVKDDGIIDTRHYFWTEMQFSKIPDLVEVLKKLR